MCGANGRGDWRGYACLRSVSPSESNRRRLRPMRIQSAVQLDLPMVVGEPVPILYVQMRLRTQAWTEQEYP